jgi:hypothetical protein
MNMGKTINSIILLILAFLLASMFFGCGEVLQDSGTPVAPENNNNNTLPSINNNNNITNNNNNNSNLTATQVVVSPNNPLVYTDTTNNFYATVLDQNGNPMANQTVTWSITGDNIGTINTSGQLSVKREFTGITAYGIFATSEVVASVGGISGSTTARVQTAQRTVIISCDKSAMVSEELEDVNSYDQLFNFVGVEKKTESEASYRFAALYGFDTSEIPAHATVHQADLKLYVLGMEGSVFNLLKSRVIIDWKEDEITFNQFDYNSIALAVKSYNEYNIDYWDTLSVTTTVQGWLNGSISNYGFAVEGINVPPATATGVLVYTSSRAAQNKPHIEALVSY